VRCTRRARPTSSEPPRSCAGFFPGWMTYRSGLRRLQGLIGATAVWTPARVRVQAPRGASKRQRALGPRSVGERIPLTTEVAHGCVSLDSHACRAFRVPNGSHLT
jgi:hypothetical protein